METKNKLGRTLKINIGVNHGGQPVWHDVDFMYNNLQRGEELGVETKIKGNIGNKIYSDGHGGRYTAEVQLSQGKYSTRHIFKYRTPERVIEINHKEWSDDSDGQRSKAEFLAKWNEGAIQELEEKVLEEEISELKKERDEIVAKKEVDIKNEILEKEYKKGLLKRNKELAEHNANRYVPVDMLVKNTNGDCFIIGMTRDGTTTIETTDKKELTDWSDGFATKPDYNKACKLLDTHEKPNTVPLLSTLLKKNNDELYKDNKTR